MRILFADESGRWSRVGTDYVGMGAVDATWPTWQVFNSRWTAALRKHDAPYPPRILLAESWQAASEQGSNWIQESKTLLRVRRAA